MSSGCVVILALVINTTMVFRDSAKAVSINIYVYFNLCMYILKYYIVKMFLIALFCNVTHLFSYK